jgi:hypothetical protein
MLRTTLLLLFVFFFVFFFFFFNSQREINSARGHITALTKRLVAAEAERARRPRVDPSSVEAAIQDKRAKVEAADLRVDACMKRQDQIRVRADKWCCCRDSYCRL